MQKQGTIGGDAPAFSANRLPCGFHSDRFAALQAQRVGKLAYVGRIANPSYIIRHVAQVANEASKTLQESHDEIRRIVLPAGKIQQAGRRGQQLRWAVSQGVVQIQPDPNDIESSGWHLHKDAGELATGGENIIRPVDSHGLSRQQGGNDLCDRDCGRQRH
jgi:hypothetical protein